VRLSRLSLLGIGGLPTTAIFAGKVKTGARVQRGQLLAEVGDSHDAQEPHLDLEVNPTLPNGRSKSRAWRRSYATRSTAAGRQILSVRSPRAARLRHMHRAARQRKILAPRTQPATSRRRRRQRGRRECRRQTRRRCTASAVHSAHALSCKRVSVSNGPAGHQQLARCDRKLWVEPGPWQKSERPHMAEAVVDPNS
jgi:hypothetical protein